MASIGLLRFVRFEIEQHLLCKRWLLPLPIVLFIAYVRISEVLVRASNFSMSGNAWDALFSVFGNSNIIFFVITLLFLYLVSDLMLETGLDEAILLRLGSRRLWWLGKTLTLGLAVLSYAVITVGIVGVVASFVLPWRSAWSEGALQFPLEFYVAPAALAMPPACAFGQLLLLLILGWFCLGLLVMVVTQFSHHHAWGFVVGVLVLFSGLGALRAGVPPPYSYLFIHQHLLFNLHYLGDAPSASPSVVVSIFYWIGWIVLFLVLGYRLGLRQDFFPQDDRV